MLTSEDRKFLTENFATKADVKLLATKEYLTKMKIDVDDLKVESSLLQQNTQRMEQRMERTEGKIDKVLTMLDGFTGKVADLNQENKMGAITLRRHDAQIHELATATGTTISE